MIEPSSDSLKRYWKLPSTETDQNPLNRIPLLSQRSKVIEDSIGAPVSGEVLLDRFHVIQRIGLGGMSVVYLAKDKVRDEQVALKFLSPSFLETENAEKTLLYEARIAMQLNHPGILKVYDVRRWQGTVFLVMELLETGNLREWISSQSDLYSSEYYKDLLFILVRICRALEYAHKTMAHRDLKPENIGVGKDLQVKLMDFGISCLTHNPKAHSSLFRQAVTQLKAGTPYYMAPEDMDGEALDPTLSDQYSVGVLAFELFTGRVPVGLSGSLADLRPDLPLELIKAIDKALSINQGNRYLSITGLGDVFQRSINLSPAPWRKMVFQIKKLRIWILLLMALILLIIGAFHSANSWQDNMLEKQSETQLVWNDFGATQIKAQRINRKLAQLNDRLADLSVRQVAPANFLQTLTTWLVESLDSKGNPVAFEFITNDFESLINDLNISDAGDLVSRFELMTKDWEDSILKVESILDLSVQLFLILGNERTESIHLSHDSTHTIEDRIIVIDSFLDNRNWPQALDELSDLTQQVSSQLNDRLKQEEAHFQKLRSEWQALFDKELGPPDMSFIADPFLKAEKSKQLSSESRTREAIILLEDSSQILSGWIQEVALFNQQVSQPPEGVEVIEHFGMQFIEVNGIYWSRWEVRVMDFARWLQEENKFSQGSRMVWTDTSIPIGPTHPFVGISRRDAKEFASWLGYTLKRSGRIVGRLPTQSEWEELFIAENIKTDPPLGVYADTIQWRSDHFADNYSDLHLEPKAFIKPVWNNKVSSSGLYGLQDGVWEWSGSLYKQELTQNYNGEPVSWLLTGGAGFGAVSYQSIPTPERGVDFILRKEGIGFRPVIKFY